jgi:PAS domain S-box-containing protein
VSTANLIAVAIADERRREALVQLAESDRRAHMILDSAHDAFIGMDADSRIVAWNAQAEKTFGWTAPDAIGRGLTQTIIPPAFREAHDRGMQRFLATGEAPVVNRRLELRGLHRDGHEFPLEITITSPMRRDAGYFFGAFLRDISDRIERDQMLRSAKEAAEAATRAKSEFLANMSHELRTPLNGVLGYAQLLRRDRGLNGAQREALDAIMKCGAHLLDLINDVLDLSKIEAGRIDIEQTATDLSQLTTDLHHVVAESARHKGLFLSFSIAPNVPRRVAVDGRHLRQVLLNLLGNAVKFTSQGEVRLDVGIDDQGRLAFAVTDTGIGVEPEDLDRIFEAFTQTRSGAAVGGTGLGLTISRHLLNAMGTDLNVESTPGRGSRFYFALPLIALGDDPDEDTLSRVPPALTARLAPGQQVTALVIDDSTVSRRILASLLDSAGLHVITAAGGFEGLELARTNRPDVIFIDVKMPDIDGFAATRKLRDNPATAAIPVIAVTASAFGDTRQAAADAGCVAYLPKPIRVESLFAALQEHLGLRFAWGPDDEPAAADDTLDPRHAAVAARLRDAAALGAVSDLHAIANELAAGTEADAALGRRIARLAAGFDFAGVAQLATALAASRGSAPVE